MRILAIETSCDETAAAIVESTTILSSVKFTQTSHAEFGGVVPSLAKRDHEARIDEIINSAMLSAQCSMLNIDTIAVTVGPGLAIALEVGINKAKELATQYNKPLIAVNHIEGHLLSPLASTTPLPPPNLGGGGLQAGGGTLGLVVSGGHTELILVEEIGKYKILAETIDDALGEALDKAARMLGLPYPGGALLEKAAALGNHKKFPLPLPMAGKEDQNQFSYSGLKSAFGRLVNQLTSSSVNQLSSQQVNDLAAGFQNRAFEHLTRVITKSITPLPPLNLRGGGESNEPRVILVGGGVIANQELRRRLNKLGEELNLQVYFAPMELTGDNAAMIGIAASFKAAKKQFVKDFDSIDRLPRWRIDQGIM